MDSERADLRWTHEPSPTWDADKQRVIGSAPEGALDLSYDDDASLPGDWWSASDETGAVVGYGWLDATWGGDAEILLAVDATSQQRGVGSFVISQLEGEAAARGLNYVYNTVRASHPNRDDVHDWLAVRGYRGSSSDTTLRKRVGEPQRRDQGSGSAHNPHPAPSRAAGGGTPYDPSTSGDRGPGHEESGGYVDIDEHQY
ncbi:MAG: GNAT family N-acetyltransferase [Nocardioidaceae bacterium]